MKRYLQLIIFVSGLFLNAKSQIIPTIGQVYDFEINDEFQYRNYDNNFYYSFPNSTRIKIIDKYYSVTYDTVFYVRLFNNYRSQYNPSPSPHMDYFFDNYNDTTYYTSLDTLINAAYSNPIIDSCNWFSDSLYFSSQYCSTLVYSNNTCINCCFEGESFYNVFGKGLGQAYFEDSYPSENSDIIRTLLYFKKDTIACGTPDSTTESILESENWKDRILVYPNPAFKRIQLDINFATSNKISIFNSNGALILKSYNYESNKPINISSLVEGMYFILIENDYGNYNCKFIKEKE